MDQKAKIYVAGHRGTHADSALRRNLREKALGSFGSAKVLAMHPVQI